MYDLEPNRLPSAAQVSDCFRQQFMRNLAAAVRAELKRTAAGAAIDSVSLTRVGEAVAPPSGGTGEGAGEAPKKSEKEDEDENAEENEEFQEGKLRFAGALQGSSRSGSESSLSDCILAWDELLECLRESLTEHRI